MPNKIHIVADDAIPLLKDVLEPFADMTYVKGAEITNDLIRQADALIVRTRTKCNQELLENTKVRFIATATIGTDHIDDDYCQKNGIRWQNAPGCNSGSVMQYIASALVRLSKKHGFPLEEKTLGIIGHGNVGSKVSRLATLLGMRVLINDPPLERNGVYGPFVPVEKILDEADIITFHVPLNRAGSDRTLHMADDNFFKILRKNAFIINTSRGEVIDSNALKKAINSGKTPGVVLDVWENEPGIDFQLLDMVDFATPHIAGYSADGKANGTAVSVQGISRFFGLGMDKWCPDNVPEPSNNILSVENPKAGLNQVLSALILTTYDIQLDDARLRAERRSFEQQRAEYPVRREFGAYRVQLDVNQEAFRKKIDSLGFNTI